MGSGWARTPIRLQLAQLRSRKRWSSCCESVAQLDRRAGQPTICGMSERIVYVSRVTRLPLVGADGSDVGHIVDVVLDMGGRPPRVNGVVIGGVQRRRLFVGAGRIGEIDTRG